MNISQPIRTTLSAMSRMSDEEVYELKEAMRVQQQALSAEIVRLYNKITAHYIHQGMNETQISRYRFQAGLIGDALGDRILRPKAEVQGKYRASIPEFSIVVPVTESTESFQELISKSVPFERNMWKQYISMYARRQVNYAVEEEVNKASTKRSTQAALSQGSSDETLSVAELKSMRDQLLRSPSIGAFFKEYTDLYNLHNRYTNEWKRFSRGKGIAQPKGCSIFYEKQFTTEVRRLIAKAVMPQINRVASQTFFSDYEKRNFLDYFIQHEVGGRVCVAWPYTSEELVNKFGLSLFQLLTAAKPDMLKLAWVEDQLKQRSKSSK